MDNKKTYKKFGTIFWWSLTILPIILALLYFLAVQFNITESISDVGNYHQTNFNAFDYAIKHSLVREYTPQWLITSCRNVVGQFNINLTFEFSDILAWAIWVQMIHFLYDVLTYVFKLIHEMLEGFKR